MDKLSQKVKVCIERGNIPFVIGGTRELSCAVTKSLVTLDKKCLSIFIRKSLDLKGIPIDEHAEEPQLHQRNSLRDILSHEQF